MRLINSLTIIFYSYCLILPYHSETALCIKGPNYSIKDTKKNKILKYNMSDREYFNSGRQNTVLFSEAKDTTNDNSLINYSSINLNNIETFCYSILWYLISAFYNIYNKKALNTLKLPWFVATIQMGMGIFLFLPLWFLKIRLPPFGNINEFKYILWQLKNVGLYTSLSHIAGVIALGSGTVSFTQVIKAAEPLFTAAIAAMFTQEFLSLPSYLSLIPVIAGVSMASLNEISFSMSCFMAGIMSNTFAAARSVFGKQQMCNDKRCIEELSPENYYSVITIISFIILIPIMMLVEGGQLISFFKLLLKSTNNNNYCNGLMDAVISGILFYLYNELSFRVLNKVNPVTHAIANTIKRIVIILSSVLVFHNPINSKGQIGSALSIIGVFIYSICQSKFKNKSK